MRHPHVGPDVATNHYVIDPARTCAANRPKETVIVGGSGRLIWTIYLRPRGYHRRKRGGEENGHDSQIDAVVPSQPGMQQT